MVQCEFDTTSGLDFSGSRTLMTESMTNFVYNVHSGKTSVVDSSVSDVRCHGIYPGQTVHLASSFSERGVMIQFCGAVRVLIPLPVWIS